MPAPTIRICGSCMCGPPTPWLRTARPSRYPRSDDATDVLGIHERQPRHLTGEVVHRFDALITARLICGSRFIERVSAPCGQMMCVEMVSLGNVALSTSKR